MKFTNATHSFSRDVTSLLKITGDSASTIQKKNGLFQKKTLSPIRCLVYSTVIQVTSAN